MLLVLVQGDAHGYAIGKAVEASTGGAVRIGPGTLYPLVRQMLADGWIAELAAEDDVRRRSYRLTPLGRRVAEAEAQRVAETVRMARSGKLLPAGARV